MRNNNAEAKIMAMGCWVLMLTKDFNGNDVSQDWKIVAQRSFNTPDGVKKLVTWANAHDLKVTNFRDGRAWL